MSKALKIYTGGSVFQKPYFLNTFNLINTNDPEEADIIVFPGGGDIDPKLYNQDSNRRTSCYSDRDAIEISIYNRLKPSCLKIGICRGMQLLSVLAGGSLIQHVDNHVGGVHKITTIDGDSMDITTCHHQMVNTEDLKEKNIDFELIAWSSKNLSNTYQDANNEISLPNNFKEPEIIYISSNNSLCIQGHPEWMSDNSKLVQYFQLLIIKYLNIK